MATDKLEWYFVRLFAFFVFAFLLAFPLSAVAERLAYPWVASIEIFFHKDLSKGAGSLSDFTYTLIFLLTVYFLFSFFYFVNTVVLWGMRKVKSGDD
jgi:hypothetical protein